MLSLSRIVWLVTGATWAARSLLERADPDYWDPVTTLDWSAVWTFSAALLLLAASDAKARRWGADGAHHRRPHAPRYGTAPAHDLREIRAAERSGKAPKSPWKIFVAT